LRASYDVPAKAITPARALPREVWGTNTRRG
jgi:hypothetical protein